MCKPKPNISLLEVHAKNMGGTLLSVNYIDAKTKYNWRCKSGHTWFALWGNVKQGKWCPKCATRTNISPDIDTIKQKVSELGGKLISSDYIDYKHKLEWECRDGHRWFTTWDSISHGSWCPTCAGNNKPTLSQLQQVAINKGGKLLSSKYVNSNTLYFWECKKGHNWSTSANNIKNNNTWCPECSRFKTESLCKTLLENKLGISLPKKRVYLDNSKWYEFDGYNKEHKVAFEYHGYQHYVYPNFFCKTEEQFLSQQRRDKEKNQYCKDRGILLIVIPYTVKDLDTYINNLCVSN